MTYNEIKQYVNSDLMAKEGRQYLANHEVKYLISLIEERTAILNDIDQLVSYGEGLNPDGRLDRIHQKCVQGRKLLEE